MQLAVCQRVLVRPRGWMCSHPACPPLCECAWSSVGGQTRTSVSRNSSHRVCTAPPTRLSLSRVVGAVSPCVQRWAARWPSMMQRVASPGAGYGLVATTTLRAGTLLVAGTPPLAALAFHHQAETGLCDLCLQPFVTPPVRSLGGFAWRCATCALRVRCPC